MNQPVQMVRTPEIISSQDGKTQLLSDTNNTTDVSQKICPNCHQNMSITDSFCPHCGKQTSERLSLGQQVWIYLVCLLGPPFGLIYFFKYMNKPDRKLRRVGFIALFLTILSLIVTFWWGIGFYNSLQQQLQQYQNLGY